MSQVAKLSGSLLLVMTIILSMGLSLQTGLCQPLNSTPPINDTVDEKYDALLFINMDEGIPDTSNLEYIQTFDKQMILSYGNGPLGLTSGLTTELFSGDDGTVDKSRKMGIFSWGSELMKINEISRLSGNDGLENELFSYGYDQSITLEDAPFPFVVIRDDLMKLSDTNLDLVNSTSNTYLFLYEDFSPNYNLSALNAAFGNLGDPSALQIKTFKYDSNMYNLSSNFEFDLSMYFNSDIWAQFGALFTNEEIMGLFNKLAHDQLNASKGGENDENPFGPGRNWWEDTEGGVYCRWGAVP